MKTLFSCLCASFLRAESPGGRCCWERGTAGVRLLRLFHGAGGLARGARHGHPSQALKERQLQQDLKAQGLG